MLFLFSQKLSKMFQKFSLIWGNFGRIRNIPCTAAHRQTLATCSISCRWTYTLRLSIPCVRTPIVRALIGWQPASRRQTAAGAPSLWGLAARCVFAASASQSVCRFLLGKSGFPTSRAASSPLRELSLFQSLVPCRASYPRSSKAAIHDFVTK